MKEKILDAFCKLGFVLDELESLGYAFSYEGLNCLWLVREDDENFLSLAVPGLLDAESMDELKFYQLMDKTNRTVKYVKACLYGDQLWLIGERELLGNEDMEELLTNMVLQLEASVGYVHYLERNGWSGDNETDTESDNDSEND